MDDKDSCFSQSKWYSSLFLYWFNFTMLPSYIARKASLLNKQTNKQKQQHMHSILSCFIFTSVVLRAILSIFTLIWNRHRLKSWRNRYQSWLLGNFRYTRRSENGRVVTIGPDAVLFDTFRVSFVSSQGFSKSGNPDVLKLFHRHSVWMIRISVLVKVNGILVKVNDIRHYFFIDLILPCFSHK